MISRYNTGAWAAADANNCRRRRNSKSDKSCFSHCQRNQVRRIHNLLDRIPRHLQHRRCPRHRDRLQLQGKQESKVPIPHSKFSFSNTLQRRVDHAISYDVKQNQFLLCMCTIWRNGWRQSNQLGNWRKLGGRKGIFFSFPNRSRIVGIDSCHSLPVSEFANSEAGVIREQEEREIYEKTWKGWIIKTLPKAQRARGLSSSCQSHIASSNANLDRISSSVSWHSWLSIN